MNALGTFRQTNPLNPGYVQLDGEQPPESQHFTDPTHPAFPFNTVPTQTPKPSRLPPMEGEVFPQLQPPPPEPLQVEELDERQKARQAKKVLDFVRDKVEAKSKTMQKVFRQFDENKDGDISYDEFRMGLRHLGVDLSDGDYAMLVAKVDVDGEGTVDYNEFAEVLKAPDMQLSFMPTESPFASGQESQMKTDASLRRKGAFDGNKRKQMGLAMLPKDDILRQIAEKVEAKSKNLRNVFREFDEDKSGSVDLVEFRRGLAHLGFEMTDKQFDALLDRVDRDGNGDINYTEFAARLKGQDQQVGGIGGIGVSDWEAEQETIAARALEEADPSMGLGLGSEERKLLDEIADKVESKSKYIRKVFRDFDEDFDGTVNHKEFRNGLSHLGVDLDDKRFAMLLKLVDADGSGSVDYGEFANSLKGQDMQVGMLPADAAAKQAAAAALNPTRPADPSQLSAVPKAKLVGLEGPAPKAPSSSGSCRSNASEKRAARHLAERQAEIDAVRDL
jgi:Ca2+-binding EF-hand superfamily protein